MTMQVSSARYNYDDGSETPTSISVVTAGSTLCVPIDPKNADYIEIMRQVADGLVIAEPD